MECTVYMGAEDIERQSLNVFRMEMLGAKVQAVTTGSATLKDATNEAIRTWAERAEDTFYIIGSAVGPHPYPKMVKEFQRIISTEARRQILEKEGRLPDAVVACVGGGSSEHEVSLMSATNVIRSIPKEKYEVICIGITKKGRWLYFPGDVSEIASGAWETNPDCTAAIISPDPIHKGIITIENGETYNKKIDVVFPVLHGRNGEDGRLQGLLELAKLPYVGCGTLSSALCMDKCMTHTVLDYNGIRTAKWACISQREIGKMEETCQAIAETLGFPVFVKPANAGSSVGVNKATDMETLREAIQIAFSHDCKVVIEEFIDGKELEVAVFGYDAPFASYVGEIQPAAEFYDYEDKYITGTSQLFIPARITDAQSDMLRETAVKAYKALGCKGLSRVDFFLQKDGGIILNEINTLPGFTNISMYPKLMEHLGMSQEYLVDKLIEQAMENAERMY